jgi:hypothetical protein
MFVWIVDLVCCNRPSGYPLAARRTVGEESEILWDFRTLIWNRSYLMTMSTGLGDLLETAVADQTGRSGESMTWSRHGGQEMSQPAVLEKQGER